MSVNQSIIEILCLAVIVMFGWDDPEWSLHLTLAGSTARRKQRNSTKQRLLMCEGGIELA